MMGGDSLVREIQALVSYRKSFGQPGTIFLKALRCCLELEGDCRFKFCQGFAIVDRAVDRG